MGQYREWLHYREIDQRLQRQRARLEQDLMDLQKQAQRLQEHNYHAHNSIVQALQHSMSSTAQTTTHSTVTPSSARNPAMFPPQSGSASLTIPNRYTNANKQSSTSASQASALSPVRAISRNEPPAQPEDTTIHTNQSEQSYSSGERRIASTNRALAIDQESRRVDQLVLRWFERWGKLPRDRQSIQEDTADV